ncbi:MAG: hypothetical protein Q8P24_17450 [Desulfobacterales bacterium]|nr:hypothetical protein [Desulfobacterales bacterium]
MLQLPFAEHLETGQNQSNVFPFTFHSSPPDLRAFALRSYDFNFRLDRLTTGIDNIRYDVRCG